MAEQQPPAILLLHDGELEDVRVLLASLGTTPISVGANETTPTPGASRWDLIVTTARRALSHPDCLSGGEGALPPARVVFASEDSPTLRRQLRATGFDYLVRRPVDSGALRLLFLRLLYQGPERRTRERYPSGREIAYLLGTRARHAVLGDLSESGCRLLHAAPARPGQRITVEVPVDDGGSATLSTAGTVIRVVPGAGGGDGSTLAVAFDDLDDRALERLREALRTSIVGSDAAPRPADQHADAEESSDRRSERRGAFRKRVVALRAEADRVLMGCDLSAGGMRVEAHASLTLGDRLRIAIYAEPNAEPWIVGATVVRDDRESGLALRFDALPQSVSRRLEAFVASLPPVEPLQRGEAGSLGAVLTQILR
jgi:hypothetical protein